MTLRSTTARRLKTATGAVDTSAAAAPSTAQVLTATSPTTAEWQDLPAGGNEFGDGSDGLIDLDGTNTYAGFTTKSGNEYTLTRNIECVDLFIDAGCTLTTNGYIVTVQNEIYGTGTLRHSNPASGIGGDGTSKSGGGSGAPGGIILVRCKKWSGTFTIESIGSNGGAGGPGGTSATGGGTAGAARGAGVFATVAGVAGATSVSGDTSGLPGNAGISTDPSIAPNNAVSGGAGGTGHNTRPGGVSGGPGTRTTPNFTDWLKLGFLAMSAFDLNSTGLIKRLLAAPSGGSGGSGGIENSPAGQGGGGGGAGGNGGVAIFLFKEKTWTGSSNFAGGTGGTGGAPAGSVSSTAGSVGSNGNAGSLIEINANYLL